VSEKAKRAPIKGGAFDARDVAIRVRRAWEDMPEDRRPKAAEIVEWFGLKGESAWTKRTKPDSSDWVPFRVDELSVLSPVLFPGEPWRPFVDDTTARVFREALNAHGLAPPRGPPVPPLKAPSEKPAGPKRRKRRAG